MALKRRQKISPNFSMASMTDLIFLLLIFFMITAPARQAADFGETAHTGNHRQAAELLYRFRQ